MRTGRLDGFLTAGADQLIIGLIVPLYDVILASRPGGLIVPLYDVIPASTPGARRLGYGGGGENSVTLNETHRVWVPHIH